MQEAIQCFHRFDSQRKEPRTEEKVFYVTEFSKSGQGEFYLYRSRFK
jgi:hypothetical protein